MDSSLVVDTEYFYYVAAQDTSGNVSDPSAMVSGIPTLRPDPPALVRGTGGLDQTMTELANTDTFQVLFDENETHNENKS